MAETEAHIIKPDQHEIDPREFRNALGSYPTGVCVITANPSGYEPFGMTINSFASVSLEPALVLWSLQNNSECYAAFEKAEGFSINVLAQEHQSLSNQYAKKGEHTLDKQHYHIGSSGQPVLNQALTSFECKIWARYPGGDHIILVGEVVAMETNPNAKPLLFHAGKYGEIC
jgi:flavin reductase (DIM6/NTAB) family NADH-FMN oxidoreductase RutF